MIRSCISLIFIVLITSCSSISDRVRHYYISNYQENSGKLVDKSRQKVYKELFKRNNNKLSSDFLVIENHSYAQGNFSDPWSYYYLIKDNKVNKGVSLILSENRIKNIDLNEDIFLRTIDTIIELFNEGSFSELKNKHKSIKYSVSDQGLIYVTKFDDEFKVKEGVRFVEFMIINR